MAKFCENGHQMDESWPECPYCKRVGYRDASTQNAGKTRPNLGATRAETETALPDAPAADFDGGKTVLLNAVHDAPVVGWLVVMKGAEKGRDYRLRQGRNTLGASPEADVCLKDHAVSQIHARLNYKDNNFVLTDLDSTNGTFVNGSDETIARIELKDGDTLRLGETVLKFKCLS